MRRTLLPVLVALLVIGGATAPAAAFWHDDDGPDIVRYGADGTPSYVVTFEEDKADALRNWANSTEGAELLRLDNFSHRATITAPAVAVRGRQVRLDGFGLDIHSGTQLAELSYVDDVWLNYEHSIVEPVGDLAEQEHWEVPTQGQFRFNDGFDGYEHPLDGVGFNNDSEKTTLSEASDYQGGDNLSASADGDGQLVAIVDTGANVLTGQAFGNGSRESDPRINNLSLNVITNESVNVSAGNFSAIEDDNLHGTWTAMAAIGNPNGTTHDSMAPNAEGLILRALDDDGSGSSADIARAIRYAAGANKNNTTADVISMSLGSAIHDPAIQDAIDYAHEQGVQAIVVAAGNSRATRSPGIASPGDYGPVITVGATNGSEPGEAWSAYFSQAGPDPGLTDNSRLETRGAMPDVAGPGMKMVVRIPVDTSAGGDISNKTLSGTSMITPQVAGGIAAALAGNSTLANADHETIHDAVTRSAEPMPHVAVVETGHGMFNAGNLEAGTAPDESQEDAMTSAAETRNEWYRAGGLQPTGLLGSVTAPQLAA